jgi:hypothetical protein
MGLKYPPAQHNDTSSYLVGGIPYVTSSLTVPASSSEPLKIKFPYVTQFFVVRCDSATEAIRVGFSRNGVKGVEQNNYFTLTSSGSFEGKFRVGELYLLSDTTSASEATIVAGLTPAPGTQISDGIIKNWSGSNGVG